MTSRLITARDDISTRWTTATPPDNTAVAYRRTPALSKTAGVIPRRSFYFADPRGGTTTEFGSSYSVVKYEFEAVVRVEGSSKNFTEIFDGVANEASLLMGRINHYVGWTSGVRYVIAPSFRVEPTDSDDVDLVISLVTEVEETDGT